MKGNFKRTLVLAAASVILGAMWLGATPASASHCVCGYEYEFSGLYAEVTGAYDPPIEAHIYNTHRVWHPDPDPPPENNVTIWDARVWRVGGDDLTWEFQPKEDGRHFLVSGAPSPYRIAALDWQEWSYYPACRGWGGPGLGEIGFIWCDTSDGDPSGAHTLHPPVSRIFVDTHSQDDTVTIQHVPGVPATVNTYEGDDIVNVANGVDDTVDCGPGEDTLVHDAGDTHTNCENAQEL